MMMDVALSYNTNTNNYTNTNTYTNTSTNNVNRNTYSKVIVLYLI